MKELFEMSIQKIGLEMTIINLIVCMGITLIYMRVFINFKDAKLQKDNKKKEVKSIVETTSMSAFFLICTLLSMLKIGTYSFHNIYLNIFALLIYVIGTAFNLLGRYYLGKNWGNNVVIYNNHTLVTNGVYRIVRHPLYASIIWMIYSVGILYQNYLVIILNSIIFIPFMTYRATQEEKELLIVFKEYKDYKAKVGMFFPKLIKRKKNGGK